MDLKFDQSMIKQVGDYLIERNPIAYGNKSKIYRGKKKDRNVFEFAVKTISNN